MGLEHGTIMIVERQIAIAFMIRTPKNKDTLNSTDRKVAIKAKVDINVVPGQ